MASLNLSRTIVSRLNICSCRSVLKSTFTRSQNQLKKYPTSPSVVYFHGFQKYSNRTLTRYFSTCGNLFSADNETPADTGSKEHIQNLVNKSKVVVFMKGIPEEPQCGFSNAVVQILRMHGVQYESYNVLEDNNLRSGVKEYSDWPTIPQVYFNGEFVGGCDILLQMHQNGDLIDELKNVGIRSALLDKK